MSTVDPEIVPDVVVNDIKKYYGINLHRDVSKLELDIYETDIGIVYRYKFIQYNSFEHNHPFYIHYYMYDNRWIRWVIVRQRVVGGEVYLKYIDDGTHIEVKDIHSPKLWIRQLVNSYANLETYQIGERYPCPAEIKIETGSFKFE